MLVGEWSMVNGEWLNGEVMQTTSVASGLICQGLVLLVSQPSRVTHQENP